MLGKTSRSAVVVPKTAGKLVPQPGLYDDQRRNKTHRKGSARYFVLVRRPLHYRSLPGGNISPSTTMSTNSKEDLPVTQQQLQQLPQQPVIGIDKATIRDRSSTSAAKTGRKRSKSSTVNYS